MPRTSPTNTARQLATPLLLKVALVAGCAFGVPVASCPVPAAPAAPEPLAPTLPAASPLDAYRRSPVGATVACVPKFPVLWLEDRTPVVSWAGGNVLLEADRPLMVTGHGDASRWSPRAEPSPLLLPDRTAVCHHDACARVGRQLRRAIEQSWAAADRDVNECGSREHAELEVSDDLRTAVLEGAAWNITADRAIRPQPASVLDRAHVELVTTELVENQLFAIWRDHDAPEAAFATRIGVDGRSQSPAFDAGYDVIDTKVGYVHGLGDDRFVTLSPRGRLTVLAAAEVMGSIQLPIALTVNPGLKIAVGGGPTIAVAWHDERLVHVALIAPTAGPSQEWRRRRFELVHTFDLPICSAAR